MSGQLQPVVEQMLSAFEKQDAGIAMEIVTRDVQGVDEISRRWIRGSDGMKEYFEGIVGMVSHVRSELSDVTETITGDTGVLTAWLEQDYTIGGEKVHISAPATVVLRKDGGQWKAALFHSIPLPEES